MARKSRERSPTRVHKTSVYDGYQRVPYNLHHSSERNRQRRKSRDMGHNSRKSTREPDLRDRNGRKKSSTAHPRANLRGGPSRPPNQKPRRRSPKKERPRQESDKPKGEKDNEMEARVRYISKICRALLARMLFVIHSMLTTWQTVQVYNQQVFWAFSFISMAILVEGAIVVLTRGGNERKWFCWSVFLYIAATVPPIWMLELHLSKLRYQAWSKNGTVNTTTNEIEDGIRIDNEIWVQLLEQFLLVILIVGRWMLPKGEITREQLSQILLAYLAIASDIVELFDVFKERAIAFHAGLRYFLLAAWTMSLMQFPFVITTSRARKMRIALTTSTSDEDLKRIQNRVNTGDRGIKATIKGIAHDLDIWAIILANGLQDIPFLIMRLTLMFGYDVFTYTMIFFTCKNALILALQGYRLTILINDRYRNPTPEEDARKLTKHYREMLSHCRHALNKLKEQDPEASAGEKKDKDTLRPRRKSQKYPDDEEDAGSRHVSQSRSRDTNRTDSIDKILTTTEDFNSITTNRDSSNTRTSKRDSPRKKKKPEDKAKRKDRSPPSRNGSPSNGGEKLSIEENKLSKRSTSREIMKSADEIREEKETE